MTPITYENDTHRMVQDTVNRDQFHVYANGDSVDIGSVYFVRTNKYRCWRNGQPTIVSSPTDALNHYRD